MFLARVIGTCVATRRSAGLDGVALRLIEPVDASGRAIASPLVACDVVGAGPGERVYYVTSREAALALDESFVPVDATIIGIVDAVPGA